MQFYCVFSRKRRKIASNPLSCLYIYKYIYLIAAYNFRFFKIIYGIVFVTRKMDVGHSMNMQLSVVWIMMIWCDAMQSNRIQYCSHSPLRSLSSCLCNRWHSTKYTRRYEMSLLLRFSYVNSNMIWFDCYVHNFCKWFATEWKHHPVSDLFIIVTSDLPEKSKISRYLSWGGNKKFTLRISKAMKLHHFKDHSYSNIPHKKPNPHCLHLSTKRKLK